MVDILFTGRGGTTRPFNAPSVVRHGRVTWRILMTGLTFGAFGMAVLLRVQVEASVIRLTLRTTLEINTYNIFNRNLTRYIYNLCRNL